jgi:hypothetical protein
MTTPFGNHFRKSNVCHHHFLLYSFFRTRVVKEREYELFDVGRRSRSRLRGQALARYSGARPRFPSKQFTLSVSNCIFQTIFYFCEVKF